jgi:protein-S-isoprenylcysteine O-methyltransferase Ste14
MAAIFVIAALSCLAWLAYGAWAAAVSISTIDAEIGRVPWPYRVADRARIVFTWLFAGVYVYMIVMRVCRPVRFWSATLLILCGMLIRLWALLYQPLSRHQLLTSGPYGYVRHPRYLGTALQLAGLVILVDQPIYALVPAIPPLLLHVLTGAREEKELKKKYPEYSKYQGKAGVLMPTLPRYAFEGKVGLPWSSLKDASTLKGLLETVLITAFGLALVFLMSLWRR